MPVVRMVKAGRHLGQVASSSKDHTERQTTVHVHAYTDRQFWVASQPDVLVSGLWEEP